MISNPASRSSLLRADVRETSKTARVGQVIDRSAPDRHTRPPHPAPAPETYRQTLHAVRNMG
jgi:hypothetical protein